MPEAPVPHPLSQAVRPLLQQAQVDPQPGVSPLVQLMQWGLQHGHDRQYPHLRPRQAELLETLAGWPEADVAAFLLQSRDDPQAAELLTPQELKGLSPPQASQALLSLLHDQLQSVDPQYPPPSPGSRALSPDL